LVKGEEMVDFKVLVEAAMKGAPPAIFIALIGVIWQLIYAHTRDKFNDKEAVLKRDLETAKFEYQREIEHIKFEYDHRKWKEQLALQLAQKHVDARLSEYPSMWTIVRGVAKHNHETNNLTSEASRAIATEVETWRYSKGGLLAEETTRDAALAFQKALWDYDGSKEMFSSIRHARRLLRASLRADMGLGEDSYGQSIYDLTATRHKIEKELSELKEKLGINT
jgi:hypothetical protein